MSSFDKAITFVLENEGGLSDVSQDAGGLTRYGISLRFLKLADIDVDGDGHVTRADIHTTSLHVAKAIYKKEFWNHYKIWKIRDQDVANKALDLVVNMRSRVAVKVLQKACNSKSLIIDGFFGPKTFSYVNLLALNSKFTLLENVRREQLAVYERIAEKNPEQKIFLHGWSNRASR